MKKKYIVISIVCILAAAICAVIGIYQYIQQQRAGQEYEKIREEVKTEEPEADPIEIPVDFASLQAQNPDVYALSLIHI